MNLHNTSSFEQPQAESRDEGAGNHEATPADIELVDKPQRSSPSSVPSTEPVEHPDVPAASVQRQASGPSPQAWSGAYNSPVEGVAISLPDAVEQYNRAVEEQWNKESCCCCSVRSYGATAYYLFMPVPMSLLSYPAVSLYEPLVATNEHKFEEKFVPYFIAAASVEAFLTIVAIFFVIARPRLSNAHAWCGMTAWIASASFYLFSAYKLGECETHYRDTQRESALACFGWWILPGLGMAYAFIGFILAFIFFWIWVGNSASLNKKKLITVEDTARCGCCRGARKVVSSFAEVPPLPV